MCPVHFGDNNLLNSELLEVSLEGELVMFLVSLFHSFIH